ncbi:PorP/SprF family type IX secretion system membrane protein [Reichenbachiella agarivorans]|uniref:PorP/SprF family type IX secretion system membrane protein n=1 Tax=Reichenbachiella agarivorans TaxID=2979464 RepID=A0ABY6CMC1_9BACT|nr:PorP/SprF family type IX secretion system membrane protein [Reichenbachiella agarivorans]UXP31651.1 PorP/SprF family type IX secretion system membrane protein [Reichenbachiella agarivorans]
MKKIIKASIIKIIVGLCAVISANAQQNPVLSTYTYNLMTVNPAYSGYHQTLDINLEATRTLPQTEGTPQFSSFTINGPLGDKRVGIGGSILNDKIGVYQNTEIMASYSYKLFSRNRNSYTSWGFYPKVVSFGIQAGLSHIQEDLLSLGISNDPEYAQNINEYTPTIGAGIFVSQKHFYLGLSAPRIVGSVFTSKNNVELQNHYYLQMGYKALIHQDVFIKPALLVKYVKGAPVQFDGNFVFEFYRKVEVGVGYRSIAGINFLVGIHLSDKFLLVYHYDTIIDNNQPEIGNSHGLMLNFKPFNQN